MTAMTLIEAAKLEQRDQMRRAVIELYSGSSSILANLPFMNIQGNAYKYNREANYPGIGFRGVNEEYTPSVGVINQLAEKLVISGGELDVDKFIVKTEGEDRRAVHEAMKIRALSLAWTRKFIDGDTANDPREFDGLQTRVTGDQVISAGSTANGAALSLAKLDEAIDQCWMPTHMIMSKKMARKFSAAARKTDVGGYITWDKDDMGKRVLAYDGLPILTVDLDNNSNEILGFDEPAASGTDTATSIYIVNMGEEGLMGLQNGGIDVADLGELDSAPIYRTRIEWYTSMAIFHGRGVCRLNHIGDLAIVA